MIEILSSGAPNVVQDRGRHGYLSQGVSRGGAMDVPALECGNALLGNELDAAGIEVGLFPFRLRFHADCCFAQTGAVCVSKLDGVELPPWWASRARAGQTLVIEPPLSGARAYLAFRGGLDVPQVMGSRSTDLKSGLGGIDGRGLRRGDRLAVFKACAGDRLPDSGVGALPHGLAEFHRLLGQGVVRVRALPAAEYEAFDDGARALFFESDWKVTSESNRLGYRLSGPGLRLEKPLELLSHGLLPGTVQVPASGQPIVQLAEANTCGGYPKIATVIEADLWRLAQSPAGTRVRFEPVGLSEAVDALRQQAQEHQAFVRELALFGG